MIASNVTDIANHTQVLLITIPLIYHQNTTADNITNIANHVFEILIAPLLTSGIVGTTLSVTIFSHLVHTEYRKNSYAVLLAALCFAFSSFFTIGYINYKEEMDILSASRWLLTAGLCFIILSMYPLYKMAQTEGYARETDQFPDSDLRRTPEYVNLMSS